MWRPACPSTRSRSDQNTVRADAEIVAALGQVGRAFFGQFTALRDVQRLSVPVIHQGESVLVASATASGKTEAALAPLVARTMGHASSSTPCIRILVIAPTRALVNDLAARLEAPLGRLGLSCGRQTSDHRDKASRPFVLITTPESFDSMLVRDKIVEGGRVVDHLLSGVLAVFVDEAHLFDGSARGDQLCWLLGRLRRVRQIGADAAGLGPLQICAGSATVTDPDDLALRLLGAHGIAVRAPGAREIDVFGPTADPVWQPLAAGQGVGALKRWIEVTPPADFPAAAEQRIWAALSASSGMPMRKVLVFVPSRNLCDTLSAHLVRALPRRRDIQVLAHHGSLDRVRREYAEKTFASARDAVLVATTTLEVGVDIGDVDCVVLVGAPPGTRALLQRIGRAGRRIGRTRVLALPRDDVECAALASMLVSARDGVLEPQSYARRWSVFVQQAASFVAQSPSGSGRRRSDLLAIAREVWPETSTDTPTAVLDSLLDGEHLIETRSRLHLGEAWADAFDRGGSGMHANLESGAAGVPVVDASTGEVIARVGERPVGKRGIALGGQIWDAQNVGGEVLLRARADGKATEGFRYATRGGPTGFEYATHVRRGFGIGEEEAPIIDTDAGPCWLHFGGSAYQRLLCEVVPGLRPLGRLSGLAVMGQPQTEELAAVADAHEELRAALGRIFDSLEPLLALGPYQRLLPETCRRNVVNEVFDLPAFMHWLGTRKVGVPSSADPCHRALRDGVLGGG